MKMRFWAIAVSIGALSMTACSKHDGEAPSVTAPANTTETATQSSPQPNAEQLNATAAPTDPGDLPASPQADDAAAAAPECKDSPMREQACRPKDTGNPTEQPAQPEQQPTQ